MIRELQQLSIEDRSQRLSDHVRTRTATVLGVDPADVDPARGFFDGGMDSLGVMELAERLQRDLGVALPRTLAFAHGSVDALTDHLLTEVLDLAEARPVAAGPTVGAIDDPIAIIGMALRLPGADSPEALWALLAGGVDATSEVPADRWDVDATYDPTPATPGKSYTRRGGFIDDVDLFDPDLFGITPREAVSLDPQQRLLLEVSWRPWSGRARPTRSSPPAAPACSWGRPRATTCSGSAAPASRSTSTPTPAAATRGASPPAGCPSPWASTGPRCR